ncbi:glycoside hydrolase family 78 protein [Neolewinella antarctica]|uniref:alpha-L-rhamnosidase n=1 Tax=Neolewinella antarctica TaxID=442734 RepID=A0ABX0XGK6_9BACT|nr:glycoside hydrolase family 78 protein [Neolewinella antarctica]NJC28455.1 alpha-L-rhamnosidase [Neolewinella antarctica]
MQIRHAALFSFLLFSLFTTALFAQPSVANLRCEYHTDPVGIDVDAPRLSWWMVDAATDAHQTAYEIRVAKSTPNLSKTKKNTWSTGKVTSDKSTNVAYAGPALASGERAYWQVRIWNQDDTPSEWSAPAFWEMGLTETSDWPAAWITLANEPTSPTSLPSHYYRKEFSAKKKIRSARLYATSHGIYECYLNGKKVGDQLFTPGFTSYHKRLQYQTYDVTAMLGTQNTIAANVADGWYRGYLGWDGKRGYYGDKLALLAQIVIEYENGDTEVIGTDASWRAGTGAFRLSDIYNGERYDARKEPTGWKMNGFDDAAWSKVAVADIPKDQLVASNGLPVRAIEEITPIEIIVTPKGEQVYDLGQNIVGRARIVVNGNAGDSVTLKFAEVLDKEGNFFTENLRAAEATDVYVLKGGGEEVFEPRFTFHGFRFIKVMGFKPTVDQLTGIVIHSDMEPTGDFSCSDELINQLQSNIQWGQKDNFLDIPTDCPQRDERVGWTGDAQVFSMTAAYNYDVASFYTKWLKDLAVDQLENGMVTHVVPDMWDEKGGATAWGDAATVIPWSVYQSYGDERILAEQYASMKGWVEFMRMKAGEDFLWNNNKDWHWGDWLAFHSEKPDYAGSVTEKDLIATAYYYYSTSLVRQSAAILGKTAEAEEYAELMEHIKAAFQREYFTRSGRLVSHTQTAYALAITFDLVPEELLDEVGEYFAEDVKKFGHLTTGFVGTPLLCSSLSKIGRDDLAFMLLNRKEYPSWLYPVTQGATTIWERWDTQKPDGSIIAGMNSFNHYAYGAIGEWLYTHVAGLRTDPEHPGYKHFFLDPHPGGGLTNANAEFDSVYGPIKSAWTIADGEMTYEVSIPPNTTATVVLPGASPEGVTATPNLANTVNPAATADGTEMTLGAGTYTFTYALPASR